MRQRFNHSVTWKCQNLEPTSGAEKNCCISKFFLKSFARPAATCFPLLSASGTVSPRPGCTFNHTVQFTSYGTGILYTMTCFGRAWVEVPPGSIPAIGVVIGCPLLPASTLLLCLLTWNFGVVLPCRRFESTRLLPSCFGAPPLGSAFCCGRHVGASSRLARGQILYCFVRDSNRHLTRHSVWPDCRVSSPFPGLFSSA